MDFTGLTSSELHKHRISVWKLAYLLGVFRLFSKLIKSVFQKLLSEISSCEIVDFDLQPLPRTGIFNLGGNSHFADLQ